MDSFLRYLRGGAVAGAHRAAPTTIAASACGGDVVEDDASFFDLEFAVPGDETDAEEERVEFNFAVAAGDDAEEVVAVGDDNSIVVPAAEGGEESGKKKDDDVAAAAEEIESEQAEVATPPLNKASALPPRPATTKFRVLLLKLRKPNNKGALPAAEGNNGGGGGGAAAAKTTNRFLIKFRVDEAASLFTRDNSSRSSDAMDRPGGQSQAVAATAGDAEEERNKMVKEVALKYLNKMKPLYVKVARLRFPNAATAAGDDTDAEPDHPASPAPSPTAHSEPPSSSAPPPPHRPRWWSRAARSASSAVAAAPPPATPTAAGHQRRDDSLLQVQDGIQSAIAHCKRSFNASKGCESPLLRSMTVPGDATRAADNSDGGDGA
ncbi:hypothetical protein PR202_gb27193 [Eleusine coracana subsp. coracana]|uniref:Uncharacterized protein n=1 Tax=Eleusine coracana subsp. coracana TaxID=191504 RepID=A0AAV5FV95_ELECO|nr:hypothetical protein PR202_gb27193 [Eleusine coracana subsp. coracana]